MSVRSGREYLHGLRERPRMVTVGGERVADVSTHPALGPVAASVAALYDLQHDGTLRHELVAVGPEGPTARALVAPRSVDALALRGRALRTRAEATLGQLGRMPDFAHSTLLAWVESDAPFAKLGADFAERLHDYHRRVSEEDLFVVPALSAPQNDRSAGPTGQAHPLLHLGVAERSAKGLRLRGARMISSLSPLADELLVYSPPMLRPGDEDHAAVFAVALDTPGLKLVCRPPFGAGGRDPAEHPVAARFEEPDAMVIFDDVLVRWERVFLDGSPELSNGLHRQTIMRELVTQQFGVRGLVRLELVTGVAIRVARTIKVDGFPQVQERLGYAVAAIEQARALLAVAEADCSATPSGTRYPKLGPMTALRLLLAQAYPSAVELLRDLGAGGLLMRPSPADLTGPAAEEVSRYYQGAGVAPAERVRLFNLAWDLAGDAFGQRGVLFERFGGGDPMRVAAGGYLGYDPGSCFALVDRALGVS